jgi:hypothetical protein
MDFEGMFRELANTPEFWAKVFDRFTVYAAEKHLTETIEANHRVTWTAAAQAGAEAMAAIVGEEMEKHPFLAKQAAKMMGIGG